MSLFPVPKRPWLLAAGMVVASAIALTVHVAMLAAGIRSSKLTQGYLKLSIVNFAVGFLLLRGRFHLAP